MKKKKIFAFTLAEVLITLSILGVVAAITVPSLINRQNEKEFVTRLKKTYSALSTAYEVAYAENGTDPATWGNELQNEIFKHMDVVKSCSSSDGNKCISGKVHKKLNGGSWDVNSFKWANCKNYILKDGTAICAAASSCPTDSSHCGSYFIDVNGDDKAPNVLGKDTFRIDVRRNPVELRPLGSPSQYPIISNECNKSLASKDGTACTGWVIYKGNMDYLRKTVSW